MATEPVAAPAGNAASPAGGSPSAGSLEKFTGLATSQLTALTFFFGAIGAAYLSFQKLQTGLGLSALACAGIVLFLLALLFFSHTLPTVLEKQRKAKLAEITGTIKPGYFQLVAREDEATFERADGKHDEVYKWLRQSTSSLLYLTGSSGSGKSSLLAAWVLPKLERDGVKIVRLRGYQDPGRALEEELRRPGAIWKRSPPETTDLSLLFEEARRKVQPDRILVVFDQFEEFLILQEEQVRVRFTEFLRSQAELRGSGSTILLVFRAEYEGFVQELMLPTAIPGQTLQRVSAFTQRAAEQFLVGSGLKFQEQLLSDVLREAAEVEETKGLIRPVTLNLCGLVLSRFATGLPHSFRPGRLIRGFVHESIFQKEVKETSPILLPKLISQQITKQPRSIEELASGTGLSPRQVQGAMFHLGSPERGIVHALDSEYRMWEISHDFLVPMIDSILAQWRVSAWKRVRPWLPLGYVAALLGILFVAPRLFPDPIGELSSQGWAIMRVGGKDTLPYWKVFAENGAEYLFEHESGTLQPESVRTLKRVRFPFVVILAFPVGSDSAGLGDWSGVANLRNLRISGDFSHFSDLRKLPKGLRSLSLSSCNRFSDTDVKDLPGSLTSLELSYSGRATVAGLTDAGLKDLPRSLTSLDLTDDKGITDAGLKDLPRSLTSLDLTYDQRITDAGLKDLPRSLTSLDLGRIGNITDAGLKDLPPSLTSLDLGGNYNITDAGLKDLHPSLTSLNLSQFTHVTTSGLKSLPGTVHVIREM